jgi:hypothetical protein
MGKHVFGFAIFVSIVAFFVLADLFLFTPPIPTLVDPIPVGSSTVHCKLKRTERISHFVESAEFDLDTLKLKARLNVDWRGDSPKWLYLRARLVAPDGTHYFVYDSVKVSRNTRYSGMVWFPETTVPDLGRVKSSDTVYASFEVSDTPFDRNDVSPSYHSTPIQPVLIVHGDRSIVR